MSDRGVPAPEPIEAAFALPAGFAGVLAIGTVAALLGPGDRATVVGVLTCTLVVSLTALSRPSAALPLAALGFVTVCGFSRAPVGTLSGAPLAVLVAVAVAAASAAGLAIGRARRAERTLDAVSSTARSGGRSDHRFGGRLRLRPGVSARRRLAGLALAAALLPALTAAMVALSTHLALVDELLFYLLTMIGVTLVGGFWPALVAAVAAAVLLNWFFTPPLHTWTIEDPTNLLALLLFVTTAVTVSSVVHLAARRGELARERTAEAEALLALARTVLGDDTPRAVLAHLRRSTGLAAVLEERIGARWVSIAGTPGTGAPSVVPAGEAFRLVVYGDTPVSSRLLDGVAVQAASACERQRLRTQAEQTEALAAANRMRTALLAAVSHDLRTPLASVKAAVSSLRQRDVSWTDADRDDLLATIEEGADRLGGLIGNLLDMSRIQTGAVQPFLRPVSLDEILPAVVHGMDADSRVDLVVPDDLPLLVTDPVLLERAVANVLANAVRFSPAGRPPEVVARRSVDGRSLRVEVVDHGPGVPAALRERVFEPFQQFGDQRRGDGVGLGLAVAKGFVEAVGGRIDAEATPGGGLTMVLELPVSAANDRRDVPV